jgi:oxygen-dependent protoporphyrinogen oxidase
MNVAVIGAGISGLVTAFRLKNRGVDVTVFEASGEAGGNIRSEQRDGFLLEYGANTFLANRNLYDLISDLRLAPDVVPPNPSARKRYIVRNGRMTQLPSSIAGLVSSRAFSTRGKLKLLAEPFVSSRAEADESVYDFFARRFGNEIADFAADPFIGGIYAGDLRKLSIETAFPRLFEYEKDHGSVSRGMVMSKKDKAAKLPKGFPRSFTLRGGVSTLIRAICGELGEAVEFGSQVESLIKNQEGYRVRTVSAELCFDAVVVSTPASSASAFVQGMDASLADKLRSIYYPPVAVVMTGFAPDQIKNPPSGFGVLVPAVEKRRVLGVLFNSSAFENRAPAGYHLYTTFIGGSRNAELCAKPERELARIALEELDSLFGVEGEPVLTEVKKWERAIPQYNVGYKSVLAAIDKFRVNQPGVFFCSNFYKGISVGDCVKNADLTATDVIRFLDR